LIVGAYPGGRGPDLRVPGKGDRKQAVANIAAVPCPLPIRCAAFPDR
jgi:uncharacterized protein YjlB